ncbi:MAG: sigma-70 family RNA polymerase sigma factor [Bacilli bacterium]|nr:sigma-70 family RNA polymerase sigma factor [Bacilli bacterium]MBP3921288.1 sigma-70 family RNA polymerase sigma factor [Bacilli bacterium]
MDIRPKRYKEYDNPYTLESIEKEELYFIRFRDEKGEHLVTVSKEVFDVFDESEKQDNNMMVRNSRYIHKYELSDEALSNKMLNNQTSIEDKLISDFEIEELYEAINELSDIQKRRIRKYFFENKTFEEIAKEENCTKRAVKFTIDIALEKISKKFKN